MTDTGATIDLRVERLLPATPEAQGDQTLMRVWQSGFPVPEIRDFFVGEVWQGALARITAYLERAR